MPADLEAVCLRCLAKDPAARYASAEALADELRRGRAVSPAGAQPVPPPQPITALFTADRDLHHVHFADARHGWLAGFGGALWRTEDGGANWVPQNNPTDVTASCLAFAPQGGTFGLAPLWNGKVLRTTTGQDWQAVDVPLGYALSGAAVVDAGCAYVLGSDGRLAHYADPRVEPGK